MKLSAARQEASDAGLALTVDSLTFDFRYWGTSNASNAVSDKKGLIGAAKPT
jgi:hypothetical protein